MKKIALFFDRTYIDAQHCFTELAMQLAQKDFIVDLYTISNNASYVPFFEQQNIRVFPFPVSKFEKIEFWTKIRFSPHWKYSAIIGTPVLGTWLAYKTAKVQSIPFYYFADELIEHLLKNPNYSNKEKLIKMNYISNKYATGTISLGKERFDLQKKFNNITYPHENFIIPNAPSGNTRKLKSNFYRDVFNIEDSNPIFLFAGTLDWRLAKKLFEETKSYVDRPYHIVFQMRANGLIGNIEHPFIKISTKPVPSAMMNYAVSSADIGLALYDKNSLHEINNGFTGGKIGTYLKNELPLIVGSAQNLKYFEEAKVATYWDGEVPFDEIATKAIGNISEHRKNISDFYRQNLQYEYFFSDFFNHLIKKIK